MKYTPTDFNSSVNISNRRPLREFLQYIFTVCILLILFYYVLGLMVDWSVKRITPEQEGRIWSSLSLDTASSFMSDKNQHKFDRAEQYLQALADRIPQDILLFPVKYRIKVMEEDIINAFAFPGGTIFITSGLLEKIPSENGLMFILGHELGHYMARDQLRQLGRGLVLLTISLVAFGEDSSVSNFISGVFEPIRNKFSQSQEIAADIWGFRVLQHVYGHSGGATDFFRLVLHERSESRLLDAFATHPLSEDRIHYLEQLKEQHKIADGPVAHVPAFLSKN